MSKERSMDQDERPAVGPEDQEDLRELLRAVWQGRWLVIGTAVLAGALGTAYSFLATPWYRAEVLMLQSRNGALDGRLSQFGGLASLAGINLGGSNDSEPMALLRSRGFAQDFIEERDLATILLGPKWDATRGTWKGDESDWPDIRDAVEFFDRKVRRVTEDRKTGVVTLAIEWRDPVLAADWANAMAARLNDRMRTRAIEESTQNVRFLKEEIAENQFVTLQQSIGKLLEAELQKLMLARNNRQYAYRIVDSAEPPKKPIRPNKVAVVAVSVLLGLLFGVLGAVISRLLRPAPAPVRPD
jgi:uncharacterized protein involved in exopolysaccharide biosynthesis